MKLIVGLGNPGNKYLFTRHNIGFMLIDSLSESDSFQKKYKSLIQKTQMSQHTVLLVKPQTFMNLSGEAVREIVDFYKIPLENILVIQDDKDQNFLSIKFQKSRGHGGHNGIKNIHEHLKSDNYTRLKLGIQSIPTEKSETHTSSDSSFNKNHFNPFNLNTSPTSEFVLSPFNKKEMEQIPKFLSQAKEAVLGFIEKGFEEACNQFNQKN